LLLEEKHTNPSNYALVVLSEGAEWEGYKLQKYGEPDAYGHRKKASVAESLANEIKRRIGEETIVSDLTYDLRSGDPDFTDKLVALTFGNMAYDAILEGKTGLMSALMEAATTSCPSPTPSSGRASWMSPACTTRSATAPATPTSAGCRCFSTARHRVAGGNPITGMAAASALLPRDDLIPLPCGRQLVPLQDAGNHITKLPRIEHEAPEGVDLGPDARRPDDVCAYRRHEGVESSLRARAQLREALGGES
jgi:hypothetical protein